MPNWVEPPLPVAMALIIRSTSTPAFRPSHRFRGGGNVDGHQQIVDELHAAGGAERPEIKAGVGKSADEALGLGAGLLVAGEIDHGLARRYHSRRAADLAVEKARALGRERRDMTLLLRDGMGP